MKTIFIIIFIFVNCLNIFSQINMKDSTVQVIGYWDKNEKQSYIITSEKIKIRGTDTTISESVKQEVEISIVDSTENSYIIDWIYKKAEINSDNELVKKIGAISENLKVQIRTNEFGVFQEVINWLEIRDNILKVTKVLMHETSNIQNMDKIIKKLEDMYSTKETIQLLAIKDIQQFYTFHGGKYKLDEEYETEMKIPNMLGGEPFDAKVTFQLDELDPEENNFVLSLLQSVDSEQLTKATLEYLTKMAETLKVPPPNKDEKMSFTNDTWISSRIHGSGWLLYSIETKEIKSEGGYNIEERTIELKD